MPQHRFTLGAVARRFGLPLWKVRRVFERRLLPEPGRIGNYRVVTSADLPRIERVLRLAGYLPELPSDTAAVGADVTEGSSKHSSLLTARHPAARCTP